MSNKIYNETSGLSESFRGYFSLRSDSDHWGLIAKLVKLCLFIFGTVISIEILLKIFLENNSSNSTTFNFVQILGFDSYTSLSIVVSVVYTLIALVLFGIVAGLRKEST